MADVMQNLNRCRSNLMALYEVEWDKSLETGDRRRTYSIGAVLRHHRDIAQVCLSGPVKVGVYVPPHQEALTEDHLFWSEWRTTMDMIDRSMESMFRSPLVAPDPIGLGILNTFRDIAKDYKIMVLPAPRFDAIESAFLRHEHIGAPRPIFDEIGFFNDIHIGQPELVVTRSKSRPSSLSFDFEVALSDLPVSDFLFRNPAFTEGWLADTHSGKKPKTQKAGKEGYVEKKTHGPKGRHDKNKVALVKDVKPHPLLKNLIKKTEQL